MRTCIVEGCAETIHRARLCLAHYQAWRLTGEKPAAKLSVCACCGKPGYISGWGLRNTCYMHRWRAGKLDEWKAYYDGR